VKRATLVPLVAVITLGLTVWVLLSVFKSTNVSTPHDSTTTIVASVDANHRFEQPVRSAAQALLLTCLADVPGDVSDQVEPAASGRDDFRVTVRPALDADDEAKVRGCIHDFVIPHVRAEVVCMRHTGRDSA
jgi:hypothetical protein